MAKTRLVDLNGSGGAYVSIEATVGCRRVEIIEDEGSTPQGLTYQLPDDGFTATFTMSATPEPIVLGNVVAHGNAFGPVLGYPQQVTAGETIDADVLIKLRSTTASSTKVRVTEYE